MAVNTERLFKLLNSRGVSGDESEIRAAITEIVRPLCDDITVDTMGNLFAHKKGSGKSNVRAMVCAHMDEVGLIVSWFRDDGLLEYDTVGGIDPRVLVSKRVKIGKNNVPGVIGAKAIHLQSEAEYHSVLGHDRLHIDIGASSAEEAKKLVKLGDYVVFDTEPEAFGDDCVCSKALDDRVGCLALISALEGTYGIHRAGGSRHARRGDCGLARKAGCMRRTGGHDIQRLGRRAGASARMRAGQGRCGIVYGSLVDCERGRIQDHAAAGRRAEYTTSDKDLCRGRQRCGRGTAPRVRGGDVRIVGALPQYTFAGIGCVAE